MSSLVIADLIQSPGPINSPKIEGWGMKQKILSL